MSFVVSFGGGTNSTAMLVGMWERGERPDAILFADTGGEKPHTYQHVRDVSAWCELVGFPAVVTVREERWSLEQDCLDNKCLPSIAYGFKRCSDHFKKRPQRRWLKNNGLENAVTCIGFDAGEWHRAKDHPNERYPLIEWGWGRGECVQAIARVGLPQPGKSACFFCPSSKKIEIFDLRERYPNLMKRALAMEANAELTSIKGLGRSFAWADLLTAKDATTDLFSESTVEIACECYDGEGEK